MSATIDPSVEACEAIVSRINSGGAYTLATPAAYSEREIDLLEKLKRLRVDVCTGESQTLDETMDGEQRSSHVLRVWVRKKMDGSTSQINLLKLLVRQLFQRLDNYDSPDRRVRVWECDEDEKQSPDKALLVTHGLFVTALTLRVTVEPS